MPTLFIHRLRIVNKKDLTLIGPAAEDLAHLLTLQIGITIE